MESTVNCHELMELIPAYSIGATDDKETQQIEAALEQCPELVAELAEYRAAEQQLIASISQVQPPAEILNNLLSVTRQTSRVPQRNSRWWYTAAACIALLMVVNNAYWFYRVNTVEQQMIALDRAQSLYLPAAVNGAAINASAQVLWIPGSNEGILLASDFPTQPENMTYQAWVTRGTQITSLGTFRVSERGIGRLVFEGNQLNSDFNAVGVTLEPMNGSSQPTSRPVVRWQSQ